MGSEMCIRDSPPRYLRTTGDPHGTFVLPVSPRYRQLPLRTPPLHRLPGDDTGSGTAPASLTAYVGDADHPTQLFRSPPTDRTQSTTGPSAFLDGTATDDLSYPSSTAPRRPAFYRHRQSLAHFDSPPRPTIFQGIVFCVCFFFLGETIFSPTECSIVSGHQTGSSSIHNPIPVPEGTSVTPL